MPIEVVIASAEEAANGVSELWLGDRLFAMTRWSPDRRLVVELEQGPWTIDFQDLRRALEEVEERIAGVSGG